MDVWHRSGSKAVASYRLLGTNFVVVGFYGPGTPVGQYDRYEVLDTVTGEQVSQGRRLADEPDRDDILGMVIATRLALSGA